MILGYRQAYALLGVAEHEIRQRLNHKQVAEEENAPKKIPTKGATGWSWGWEDEEQLKAWWHRRVRVEVTPASTPTAICGYNAAAKVLGVKREQVVAALKQTRRKKLPDPPRTVVQGGRAFTWASPEALRAWFRAAGMSQEQMVIGVRSAALVLGVQTELIQAEIERIRRALLYPLLPSQQLVRGEGGQGVHEYAWKDEADLVEWWEKVRGDEFFSRLPPAISSKDVSNPTEKTIEALLGPGTTKALMELGRRLDSTGQIPLQEVLVIVVGLGLVNWPDEG